MVAQVMTMPSEAVRTGRVVSVSGAQIIVLLEPVSETELGRHSHGLQIGEVVKLATPASVVFGLVTGLNIPLPDQSGGGGELRIAELELFGEIELHEDGPSLFQRGVSVFPSLDDAVYRASPEDLRNVFIRPEMNGVRIGTLHQDKSVPAFIVPNDLLGKHFAVLGTTGSGKSCAVATILRAVLAQHPKAHVVILDPHNEYATAFGDIAEIVTPENLELPYWLLNFEELSELVIGADRQELAADSAALNLLVTRAKRELPQNAELKDQITIDTPAPYRLSDVTKLIDEVLGKLDKPTDMAAYQRIRERLQRLQSDRRYGFMFPGIIVRDNMAAILSRLFRVPVAGKPVTVLDISGLPSETLNVVVSLLHRMIFDFALWADQKVPILLVCEEAHRYAPNDERSTFEPTKRALMRIAKEGRKYGISLCLVSQRPSELATTVLSQCSTIFALRMTSQKDQDFLAAALPESSAGLMAELPSLRNAEAIAVGEGVPVPARICFDRLPDDAQPRSNTAPFSSAWSAELTAENFLQDVVARWRRQR